MSRSHVLPLPTLARNHEVQTLIVEENPTKRGTVITNYDPPTGEQPFKDEDQLTLLFCDVYGPISLKSEVWCDLLDDFMGCCRIMDVMVSCSDPKNHLLLTAYDHTSMDALEEWVDKWLEKHTVSNTKVDADYEP